METCSYIRSHKKRSPYGKKNKRKKIIIISATILIVLIIFAIIQYFAFGVPAIRIASEERIRQTAMVAIEDAAMQTFTSDITHDDLVYISRDIDGNIQLMQANTMFIQSLVRIASARALENLSVLEDEGVEIPFGTFTGFGIFAGYGRPVSLRVMSANIMGTDINSDFISAGINQTIHRITLILSSEVVVIMPGSTSRIEVSIPVPILESTIIGRVPDVFLQSDFFSRTLNLVP